MAEVAALADEGLVDQALGDDDMRERVEDRDVRSGLQREMMVGLDVRAPDEIDAARIDDDEPRAGAQALLQARGEHRMGVGRIGADHEHDVRLVDRLEILRAGRRADRSCDRPKPVGEWQTRAQVSILLLPKPARTSFWTRNTSSLVQRDDEIAPTESRPYCRLDALELARRVADAPRPTRLRATGPRSARGSSA